MNRNTPVPARRTLLPGLLVASLLVPAAGCAELLSSLDLGSPRSSPGSPEDALREALRIGAGRAVEALGRPGGYLERPEVRIPVPDSLEPIARGLRALGAGDLVERFEESMNRAAEAAAPVARDIFVEAIREMTVQDAWAIVRGEAHEATDYLRRVAGPRLEDAFRPIVRDELDRVGATWEFQTFMDRAARLPLVERPPLDLTDYVTRRALDGLFLMLAREEERIRRNPAARTTELLRRYFGRQGPS